MEYLPNTEKLDLKHISDLRDFPDPPQTIGEVDIPSREDILDFGDEGFLLRSVLSLEECAFYMSEGEKIGFAQIEEATKSYRNSCRISFHSVSLAELLWKRIRSHLSPITISGDPHKQHIHGVEPLLQGEWTPIKLNPVFRLCRYYPGGHFAPHFDGHLVESAQERSLQTFMLYLNGPPQFEGGATNFINEDQALYMDENGRYCAEEKNILHAIRPDPGLGIIFNHHRLHEGQAVRSGPKYILRTEVMFRKSEAVTLDPKDEEAYKLVQEAERLEAKGDNMAAMELYRKAFKLSPSLAKSYGN